MPMNEEQVKDLLVENDFLNNQNSNYRAYCQDLADYILPRKAWITTLKAKGERLKFNFLYDSTAIRALRDAASNFHTNLNDESSRWFGLRTFDQKFMRSLTVRKYFEEVEDKMFTALHKSNYYNVSQEFYMDYLGFGTSTFSMLEDAREFVRFMHIPIGEVNRVVDSSGRLSEIYRNFKLTARQAFKLFGNKCGVEVMKALDKKPFEEFAFLHYVGPRHVRDVSREDSMNMAVSSLWINVKEKKLIEEKGFHEMPFMSEVFYKDNNDPNGFSPAMDIFPEIKLVNAMQRTFIRADMKQTDPAYVMPSRGFMLPLNLNPAAVNYREEKTNNDDLQLVPTPTGRLSMTKDHIQMIQDSIRDGLFIPLFRSLSDVTKQMTIPEVQQRISENMKVLGPVIGRILHGIHDPMIIRLFNMLNRSGLLPPPPLEIQDEMYTPFYLSPLAKAQRQSKVVDIQLYLGDLAMIGQVKPSVYDNIDEDKLANVLARERAITPEIQREMNVVDGIRQQRAQQEQQIAALQAGESLGRTGRDLAQAEASGKAVQK